MASALPSAQSVMNLSEFIIIYLACGAPFGVHYFLQNRRETDFNTIVLKSFLTVFVWIPYALQLFHSRITKELINKDFEKNFAADAARRNKLDEIQKNIWQIASKNNCAVSLFEFREIFERYVGLTLAMKETVAETFENELFTVAKHPDKNLGAKCLHRRNRSRLDFHQTLASRDFLKLLSRLRTDDSEKLRLSAIEFVKILDDAETLRAVEKLFAGAVQRKQTHIVQETEKEVWNTDRHKPLPAKSISINLPSAMNPKTVLSKRD
jgi:hypothetical protein